VPQFSQVTSNIIEALVSVKRLSEFLHAEELQQDAHMKVQKNGLAIGDEVCNYLAHLDAVGMLTFIDRFFQSRAASSTGINRIFQLLWRIST
jgi:hypothetical protein